MKNPTTTIQERINALVEFYKIDPTRYIMWAEGNRIRTWGGWYRHDYYVYRGVPLEGTICVKREPKRGLRSITCYGNMGIPGSDWTWLLRQNITAGLAIPIRPGDHVKNTITGMLGFVTAVGEIKLGRKNIPGYMVDIGRRKDFFAAGDTALLWTVEQLEIDRRRAAGYL